MPAGVGGTGSIALPGETHGGIEEGRKGGGLGVTGANTARLCNPDPFWCQSFAMDRGRRARGWVETSPPWLFSSWRKTLWLGSMGPARPAEVQFPVLPDSW